MYVVPFDLLNWIEKNRASLRPPVANKVLWENGDLICMIVGGPNQRDDYHVNEGGEFFYQIEGRMNLAIINREGKKQDIPIRAGEVFLLPPNTPHSPQRPVGSVGLVIEKKRREKEMDSFVWFCKKCDAELYRASMSMTNIETQLKELFATYNANPDLKKCRHCGFDNSKKAEAGVGQ